MKAPYGRLRTTDCANTERISRIIQYIPSQNAEPFKRWLAKVGKKQIDEIENPKLAQERMNHSHGILSVFAIYSAEVHK